MFGFGLLAISVGLLLGNLLNLSEGPGDDEEDPEQTTLQPGDEDFIGTDEGDLITALAG